MNKKQNLQTRKVVTKARSLFHLLLFAIFLQPCIVNAATDLNDQINVLVRKLWLQSDGVILKATDTKAYLSIGQNYGVQAGSQFKIIQQGEPLKLGTEIIGYEESVVALIEVESVREKLSICKIIEKNGTPKKGDKAQQLHKTFKNIMINQFSFNDGYNRLTKSLQETLSDAVTNLNVGVVNREKMETVMKKQKVSYSSLKNPKTAARIASPLGAQGLLLGNIVDMGEYITISGRMIDVASGKAVSMAEVEFPKTSLIAKLLKMPIDDIVSPEAPPNPEPIPTPQPAPPSPKPEATSPIAPSESVADVNAEGYLFSFTECTFSKGSVSCKWVITNNTDDKEIRFRVDDSRLFDSNGNVYTGNSGAIGNVSNRWDVRMRMIKGIPTKTEILFPDVDKDIERIALLELDFDLPQKIQFRDIPVVKE